MYETKRQKIFDKENFKKNRQLYNLIIMWLVVSFIGTIAIELLNRGSFAKVYIFMFSNFLVFLLNYLIFLSITSISFLFKKTKSVYVILTGILMIFGVGTGVVMKFRGSPVTAADLYTIKDGLSMAKEYLNIFQIILIMLAILSFIILIIVMFKKEKKSTNFNFMKNLAYIILPIYLLTFGTFIYDQTTGKIKLYRWDLTATYSKNGTLFSFINSAVELIPSKPETYSQNRINQIKDNLDEQTATVASSTKKPNIIVVQLESFLDPLRLQGITFDEDPIPNVRQIQEKGPHGLIKVPSFGGGTVRTEFEVLSGYSANNLGPGEIPNNTILKKQSVESLAYILKNQGYNTTAVHDYIGNFYNRDSVYANYGFDNLVSMEYMDDLQYTYDYPSDMNNLAVIEDLIDEKEPQFIFNIAVESHGPYDKQYLAQKYTVNGDITDEERNQIQEYVDKAIEVDRYVKSLIDFAEASGEPTIIAMYGDHLPALSVISNEKYFPQEQKYDPEYFIWSNMPIDSVEQDIKAYQLSTYVLGLADIDGGIMPTFHLQYAGDENYDDYLKDIQYDQLYGSNYLLGQSLYKKSDMKLGLDDVKITKAYIEGDQLIVEGENLTKSSRVLVDGKAIRTTYDNSNKIVALGFGEKAKMVQVGQEGMYGKMLTKSNEIPISKNE